MEEVKKQIQDFKDWDDSKKRCARNCLKGDNLGRFDGLSDRILQAALEAEMSEKAGGCTCSFKIVDHPYALSELARIRQRANKIYL